MKDDSSSVDVLAERVRFDIIGKTESGHELRVWTDGDRVVWQDDEGRSGYMPAMLFRIAAHAVGNYCEEIAIEKGEDGDNFYNMVHDSLRTPVTLAMSHPYWAQPDHEANGLRFGFSSIAVNMATDVQPNGLKPRAEAK